MYILSYHRNLFAHLTCHNLIYINEASLTRLSNSLPSSVIDLEIYINFQFFC
jgi:hypothetical protein